MIGLQNNGSFIQQTITGLQPNQSYTLRYSVTARPGYGQASYKVEVGSATKSETKDDSASFTDTMFVFQPTSSSITLKFTNTSATNQDKTILLAHIWLVQ
jgi:hypothetical protein